MYVYIGSGNLSSTSFEIAPCIYLEKRKIQRNPSRLLSFLPQDHWSLKQIGRWIR